MWLKMQSLVLVILLAIFTSVKGQDCTLSSFRSGPLYDENFDISGLDDSYSAGKQVRVPCSVGFSGFFKLICTEGRWISRGQICEPRSCGHPGDALYAEFHLEKKEDFVFGSEVVYTCQRGYQMVSRNNRRRCMAEGWDGVIPVCEPIHCPWLDIDNNVFVSGDPEEANYGNVLRFSCGSNLILEGESEIFCNEEGKWSGVAPKCTELRCLPREIENGEVDDGTREYKEGEVLDFTCNPGYKRTHNIQSRCVKISQKGDWVPTPLCEEIKCSLIMPAPRGTTYTRTDGKSQFLVGENVTVQCDDKYYIEDPLEQSRTIQCQANGGWDAASSCNEVFCSDPQDVNVNNRYYYRWSRKRLGETQSYSCKADWRIPAGFEHATCTRAGWEPKPLCQEIRCDEPNIPHAVITRKRSTSNVHKNNDWVEYQCQGDFEGHHRITCSRTGWREITACRERTCSRPDDFAQISSPLIRDWTKRINETLVYTCKDGYRNTGGKDRATCTRQGWIPKPLCEDSRTCTKPVIQNGYAVGPRNSGTFYYSCNEDHKLSTKGWWADTKCHEGVWSNLAHCIGRNDCAGLPAIPNAKLPAVKTNVYTDGSTFGIECQRGYLSTINEITCRRGKWDAGQVKFGAICISDGSKVCSPPPKVVNAIATIKYQKKYYPGTKVTYACRDGYKMRNENEDWIMCTNGNWDDKNISCTRYCTLVKSPKMTVINEAETYLHMDVIEYQCQKLMGAPVHNATCVMGEWSTPVKCEEPCRLHRFPYELHISDLPSEISIESGETKTVKCIRGYYSVEGRYWKEPRTSDITATCKDGVITYQQRCA